MVVGDVVVDGLGGGAAGGGGRGGAGAFVAATLMTELGTVRPTRGYATQASGGWLIPRLFQPKPQRGDAEK